MLLPGLPLMGWPGSFVCEEGTAQGYGSTDKYDTDKYDTDDDGGIYG